MDVDELIDALIDREGGYANHPSDRGGPTNFGITETVARAHGFSGPMRSLPRRGKGSDTAFTVTREGSEIRVGRAGEPLPWNVRIGDAVTELAAGQDSCTLTLG